MIANNVAINNDSDTVIDDIYQLLNVICNESNNYNL